MPSHYVFVQQVLAQRRSGWALLAQAKICLMSNQFDTALELCDEAIANNRYFAEAFDIKAQCFMAMSDAEQALNSILAAAEIAPFNMNRQYLLIEIARQLDNIPQQVQASKQLYEITRRSVKQDVIHLLNYIRSIIDAAVKTDDPAQRNRYLQDVSLALQRVKRDEGMTREIDFDLFENLCQARLESLSGAQYLAKKTYAALAEQLPSQLHVLPDAIFLLNQIGEFEQAATLKKLLPAEQLKDPMLSTLLADQSAFLDNKQKKFSEFNKAGIECYKQGNYFDAIRQFEQALELAPMNTGSALNLIQASIQQLNQQKKRKSAELFERCKKTFRIVDNMPMSEQHRARYRDLLSQFNRLREELQR